MAKSSENWIEVGQWTWFYRQAEPIGHTERLPVVLLHGLPSQSYGWREVLPALSEPGFRAIAPDWLGFGFSAKPDRRDFAYTPDAFIGALGDFLSALQIERFSLVVQGFFGFRWLAIHAALSGTGGSGGNFECTYYFSSKVTLEDSAVGRANVGRCVDSRSSVG